MYLPVALLAFALIFFQLAPQAAALSSDEIYSKAAPSVVHVVLKADSELVRANGFFVRSDVIAAPYYLLKGHEAQVSDAQVTMVGQEESYPVQKLLAKDEAHDLVLLLVPGTKAPPLALNSGSEPPAASPAYILGDRLFKAGTVTIDPAHKASLVIAAPVSPGCAGAVVLNQQDSVVGVVIGGLSSGKYVATPASWLKALMSGAKL